MRNIAIILAGGVGHRYKADIPKQFIIIDEYTVLEWSVRAFVFHPGIDEICVVIPHEWIEYTKKILNPSKGECFSKIRHIVAGGKERHLSTAIGLNLYTHESCRFLIHDAARPFITPSIISKCLDNDYEACAVGIPVSSTIWQTDNQNELISHIPKRNVLWEAQTPQCFYDNILRQAFDYAKNDNIFDFTDECSVVKYYLPKVPIHLIEGEVTNIKITHPSDIILAKEILANRKMIRSNNF